LSYAKDVRAKETRSSESVGMVQNTEEGLLLIDTASVRNELKRPYCVAVDHHRTLEATIGNANADRRVREEEALLYHIRTCSQRT
jgi:hypothetical protein